MDGLRVVEIAPGRASDDGLVAEIAALTNAVYAVAEAGFWRSGVVRTSAAEVAGAIASGQILAAYLDGHLVGVVRVSVTGTVGTFGMLAVPTEQRGAGIGRRLVAASENLAAVAGAEWMQIEVVVPTASLNASKVGLGRWYESLGYHHVGRTGIAEHYPGLEADLAIGCHLAIYRKFFVPPV